MNLYRRPTLPVSIFGGAGHFATLHAAHTLLECCARLRKVKKDSDFPALRLFSDPLDDFDASGALSKKDSGILTAHWLRMLASSRSNAIVWVVCNTWHASLPHHPRKFEMIANAASKANIFLNLSSKVTGVDGLANPPIMIFCSEGARAQKLFDRHFSTVRYPDEQTQKIINILILSVMANGGQDKDVNTLKELLYASRHLGSGILIGCSELSILWSRLGAKENGVWPQVGVPVWDTIQCAAEKIAERVYDESV